MGHAAVGAELERRIQVVGGYPALAHQFAFGVNPHRLEELVLLAPVHRAMRL